ncbi:MAG: response regulator [Deltaproteobacteria bacterium]|nr:response regulator [Deltaproteobacteria bacterium]
MSKEGILKDKIVLVVDDEQDTIDTVEEELDMCIVDKAYDYNEASQFLLSYTYDVVVLDIIGVNGFELLKIATSRGFPTVILTAHAVTQDVQKKSIKLGAISFLPKEKMHELVKLLEDVISGRGKS